MPATETYFLYSTPYNVHAGGYQPTVVTSQEGIPSGGFDTGRVVAESHENDIGSILGSGGLLPITAYNVYREWSSFAPPSVSGNRKNATYFPCSEIRVETNGQCDVVTSVAPTLPEPEGPNWTALRTRAHADANSAAIDALTNLAELPETVRMARGFLGNLEQRARRIAHLVKNRNRIRASRSFEEFTKLFSDAWLEWRYGWRPLIGSAQDLVDAARVLQSPSESVVVSGRDSDMESLTGDAGVNWTDNVFGGWTRESSCTRNLEYRAFVSHLIRREAAAIGINPLVTAWELVPYSFVIDWFTGIGDSIQANCLPPGVQATTAGSSIKDRIDVVSTSSHPGMECTVVFQSGRYEYHREEYTRFVDSTLPPPPAIFSVADRMAKLNWLDLVILANGLLERVWRST